MRDKGSPVDLSFNQDDYPSSRKDTVMVVTTSTGTPFNRVGWYCHWRAASMAALIRSGSASLSGESERICPPVPMTAPKMTVPSIPCCWALAG